MNWQQAQIVMLDGSAVLVQFAVNWLLQSALLIAIGLVTARLVASRGSAAQSAVYRTTLAAVLVCPLASFLLSLSGASGWSLAMPRPWTLAVVEPALAPAPEAVPQLALSSVADSSSAASLPESFGQPDRPIPSGEPSFSAEIAGADGHRGRPVAEAAATAEQAELPVAPPAAATLFSVHAFGWLALGLAAVWLLVSTWLLGRLGLAWWQLAHSPLRRAGLRGHPANLPERGGRIGGRRAAGAAQPLFAQPLPGRLAAAGGAAARGRSEPVAARRVDPRAGPFAQARLPVEPRAAPGPVAVLLSAAVVEAFAAIGDRGRGSLRRLCRRARRRSQPVRASPGRHRRAVHRSHGLGRRRYRLAPLDPRPARPPDHGHLAHAFHPGGQCAAGAGPGRRTRGHRRCRAGWCRCPRAGGTSGRRCGQERGCRCRCRSYAQAGRRGRRRADHDSGPRARRDWQTHRRGDRLCGAATFQVRVRFQAAQRNQLRPGRPLRNQLSQVADSRRHLQSGAVESRHRVRVQTGLWSRLGTHQHGSSRRAG